MVTTIRTVADDLQSDDPIGTGGLTSLDRAIVGGIVPPQVRVRHQCYVTGRPACTNLLA